MLNKGMSAGTNAEQRKKDETQLASSPTIGNTNVVCSPNVVSTEKELEEEKRQIELFEQKKQNGYGHFVFNESGEIIGVAISKT